MKTADPEVQFSTSLKNGKLGVFRIQTLKSQIEQLLGDQIVFDRTDYNSLTLDGIEMVFNQTSNLLESAIIKFSLYETEMLWQRALGLLWIDWFAKISFEVLAQSLIIYKIGFKKVEYTDGSSSFIIRALPATVEIVFVKPYKVDSLRLDFSNPYQVFSSIRTMTTY